MTAEWIHRETGISERRHVRRERGHPRLHRLGRAALEAAYLPAVGHLGLSGIEVLDHGARTGHLGAGDVTAG
ncbi:hypothetical protein [Streptomyces sp. CBMA123]|uniref:hypothetical protein n=1 Tax=Streptomyces sp. CBMA123 TaxID=1896313 RepID=UPI001661D2C1|nr:hypothetical protein [Streptomyces sp. CBMA123]MBD0691318.1 hypothetical protein [Streptomyces sp. CBMA123]